MGVMVKVWLGGEGPNEIGGRGHEPPDDRRGFIEAVLNRIEPTGWQVEGATTWSRIRKYRTGVANPEERSVLGLVLEAQEHGCEVVVFTRDSDGDDARRAKIDGAIEEAKRLFDSPPIAIAGGAACPALEGWLLALCGERDTDAMSRPRTRERLEARGYRVKDTRDAVAILEACDEARMGALAPGTDSLCVWLDRVRAVMAVAIRGTAGGQRTSEA